MPPDPPSGSRLQRLRAPPPPTNITLATALIQYFLNRELSFLLNCGKITSIQRYVNIENDLSFSPVALIVASKYYSLTGSLLFKDRSWGADYNCPSHHTAEVSQEQAG